MVSVDANPQPNDRPKFERGSRRLASDAGVNRRTVLRGAAVLTLVGRSLASARTAFKMAKTSSLNIGYEETGPSSGYPILLLHGRPYDPRSFDDVVVPLADSGYRVIVPYSRCFGPTVYRSPEIFRSG